MRQRENERAEARDRASERASMAAAGYRMAREDEPTGPMMFQPRGVEIQEFDFAPSSFAPPAPDVEEGRIRGTGAAAAPGQTYSAVARALEEEKPTVRTRTVEGPDIELPSAGRRGFETIEGAYGSYLRPDETLLAQVERERVAREAEDERQRRLEDEIAAEQRKLEAEKSLASYETDLRRGLEMDILREQASLREPGEEEDPYADLRKNVVDWVMNTQAQEQRTVTPEEIEDQVVLLGGVYGMDPRKAAEMLPAIQRDLSASAPPVDGVGAPAPRTAESILQDIIQSRESAAMESQRIEAARQNAAEQARLLEEALRMSQLQGTTLSASETASLFDDMNAFRREAGLPPLLRIPQ